MALKPKIKPKSSARPAADAPNSNLDAIKLLKTDHDKVGKLFDQYDDGVDELSASQKKAIATQICEELTAHATVEEEIFYPEVQAHVDEVEDMLAEAYVEHNSLKRLIADIAGGEPGSVEYDAYVKVLGEYVHHHVEEEENELFPKVRKSKIDLQSLGTRMSNRKSNLTAQSKLAAE